MLRAFTRSFTSTIPKKNFANGQLFGRVGNVDFKESANGVKYVRYSLAVNKFRKGEDSITDWYNITTFDEEELQRAEKALRVGNKMIVDVTLRLDKFEDPETKKVQTRTSLIQRHAEVVQWGKRTDEDRPEATE